MITIINTSGTRAVGLLAFLFVLCTTWHTAVAADTSPLAVEVNRVCGPLDQEAKDALQGIETQNIPSSILRAKLNEGVAKNVPPERIRSALVKIARDLLWLHEQLRPCTKASRKDVETLLSFATDVIASGIPRDRVAPLLVLFCAKQDIAEHVANSSELYFHLVNRLDAPRPESWALTTEIARQSGDGGSVSALIGTLQDIRRNHSSLARPMAIAIKHLRSGASLRRTRNELREQFLRP